MLTKRGFDFAPLQAPWVRECLGPDVVGTLTEMRVFTLDGRLFGGADAVLFLARRIWWACPLGWAGGLPGVRALFRYLYRWLAKRRYCLSGTCRNVRHTHSTQPHFLT